MTSFYNITRQHLDYVHDVILFSCLKRGPSFVHSGHVWNEYWQGASIGTRLLDISFTLASSVMKNNKRATIIIPDKQQIPHSKRCQQSVALTSQ